MKYSKNWWAEMMADLTVNKIQNRKERQADDTPELIKYRKRRKKLKKISAQARRVNR